MPDAIAFDSVSVIIPTYNRQKVLAKVLEGYLALASPHLVLELIVVDDGSTDGTESTVQEFSTRSVFPVRYLRQPNKGPAAARNVGIREAHSSLLLFTDSDIIPKGDLVEQHINWHRKNPQIATAVLGYVTWPREIRATPFMRWYGENQLFHFSHLRNKNDAGFRYFYTCNLSLKADFLRSYGQFDEDFKSAAYEDIELGYRLSKRGLQVLYNPEAIGYHYQFFSFNDACKKNLGNAAAAQLFLSKQVGQKILQDTRQKHSGAGYTLAKRIAWLAAKMFAPARRLLDSQLPLPNIVYRLFFWASNHQSPGTPKVSE